MVNSPYFTILHIFLLVFFNQLKFHYQSYFLLTFIALISWTSTRTPLLLAYSPDYLPVQHNVAIVAQHSTDIREQKSLFKKWCGMLPAVILRQSVPIQIDTATWHCDHILYHYVQNNQQVMRSLEKWHIWYISQCLCENANMNLQHSQVFYVFMLKCCETLREKLSKVNWK